MMHEDNIFKRMWNHLVNFLRTIEMAVRRFFHAIHNYFFVKKYPFWKISDNWYCYNTSIYDSRRGSKKFFDNYVHTWYDDIPYGWRKAFGKQLSEDIKKTGTIYIKQGKKWRDILSFEQIKEKYGSLCLYASAVDTIQEVLKKYEYLSECYCINCGKPARYITRGWIEFYCEKCFEKIDCWTYVQEKSSYKKTHMSKERIAEHKAECRITEDDIPNISRYEYKILKTEYFDTEEEMRKRLDELWDAVDRPIDMCYMMHRLENKFAVEHKLCIRHDVDMLKEYNIDYRKMWGLDNEQK